MQFRVWLEAVAFYRLFKGCGMMPKVPGLLSRANTLGIVDGKNNNQPQRARRFTKGSCSSGRVPKWEGFGKFALSSGKRSGNLS
jgi:hypothetical protein